MSTPTADDTEELLLSCRYGDIEDIQKFVEQFGLHPLSDIRDENGNSVLHMICGNGHADILDYLLPLIPPLLLSAQNRAQSTPLHWAALNSHLPIVQKLVQYPGGPGIDLIDTKNAAGRSPLGEAELAGWEEGAKWLVQMMKLDRAEGVKEEEGGTLEEGETDGTGETGEQIQDIEVEIEDANGQLAKMTLSGGAGAVGQRP